MKFSLRAGPAKAAPDQAETPAPAMPPAEAAALAVFMAVVSRVEAVIEAETEAFTRNLAVDMAALNHRKRHGLLELSRITRTLPVLQGNNVARDKLSTFGRALERNRVVLDRHLRALREVADIVARSLKEAESDGTYSRVAGRS